jgi:hypothetical protein
MSLVHVEDKETSEVFAEHDGLWSKQGEFLSEKRVSVKQNGCFRSLVKPGQWDERFEGQESPAWLL